MVTQTWPARSRPFVQAQGAGDGRVWSVEWRQWPSASTGAIAIARDTAWQSLIRAPVDSETESARKDTGLGVGSGYGAVYVYVGAVYSRACTRDTDRGAVEGESKTWYCHNLNRAPWTREAVVRSSPTTSRGLMHREGSNIVRRVSYAPWFETITKDGRNQHATPSWAGPARLVDCHAEVVHGGTSRTSDDRDMDRVSDARCY